MEWQPIEIAPKDGTEILVWNDGNEAFVAFWHERKSKWMWTIHDLNGDEYLSPTHWMPLPPHPVSA